LIPLVLILGTLGFRILGALGVRRFRSWPVAAAHALAVMLVLTASAHFVPASVTVMPNHADMVRMVPPFLPYAGALWIIRAVLLGSLVVHVYAAATLWKRARRARTVRYQVKKHTGAIFASRLMRWGGVTLLLFIIWHLLNFTVGKVNVQGGPTNDPYNLLVDTFDTWWLTLIYLLAMLMLGAHLHHGTWSALQTLGLTGTERARVRSKRLAFVVALVITGGFSLVPIFVLAGVITK